MVNGKVVILLCLIASLVLMGCTKHDSGSSSMEAPQSSGSSTASSLSSSSDASSRPSSSSSDFGGYYSSISDSLTNGLNGTLRTSLTSLIQPSAYYSYSGSGSGDLGYELENFDEDPKNASNMYMFYLNVSIPKETSSAGTWNREHVWPQSLSDDLYGKSGGGADALHIRPTVEATNSRRGNLKYGEAASGSPATLDFRGTTYTYAHTTSSYFEPSDEVKGDCARIVFYMYVCYFANRGTPIANCCESIARMVEWSELDPVSELEAHRNDCAQRSRQRNRNPFVDHPEWVRRIFEA
ncbi:MAG: endonuclease [Bacilli bacterium]|nr:endonuclease [Bacilli bacterium]